VGVGLLTSIARAPCPSLLSAGCVTHCAPHSPPAPTPQVILDALLGSGAHSEALQAEAAAKDKLKEAMERKASQAYGGGGCGGAACACRWWQGQRRL
jgi:hypothetical protein